MNLRDHFLAVRRDERAYESDPITAPRPKHDQLWLVLPTAFLFFLPFAHTAPFRLLFLSGTAILALVASIARSGPPLPCKAPILVWIAVSLAGVLWSIDRPYSIGEFRNEVVYPMVAFAAFFVLTASRGRFRLFARAVIASAIAASIYGLLAFAQNRDWSPYWVGDPNAYSTFVVLIAPVLLLAATRLGRNLAPGWLVGIALALALICGHLTLNRMLWPTLSFMIFVFFALHLQKVKANARMKTLSMLAFIALLSAFAALYLTAQQIKVGRPALAVAQASDELAQDPRPQIWAHAYHRFMARPLLGYGYGRGILRQEFRAYFDDALFWHAHNMFINTALQTGLIGVLSLLWLYVALGRQCLLLYRDHSLPVAALGALGLTLLLGALLKSLTDDILIRENALLLWAELGMTLGLGRQLRSKTPIVASHAASGI